jgi:hypothetical protein
MLGTLSAERPQWSMKGERAARAMVNASGKRLTYRQPYEA